MAPSRPLSQSKHHEPRIVDLDDRDNISREPPIELGESSDTVTPNTRLSQEYGDNTSQEHMRWQRGKLWNHIPQRVAKPLRKAIDWIKGPQPPRAYAIVPLFEPVQMFPARLLARLPKAVRFGLLFLAFFLWVALFGVILSKFGFPTDIAGYGAPVRLSCIDRLWYVWLNELPSRNIS
jgi:hypothetical protein